MLASFLLLLVLFQTSWASLAKLPLLSQQVNTTQADLNTAREIHQFLRDLRRNSINLAQVQKLKNVSKKSFPFEEIQPYFELTEKIQRGSTAATPFFQACNDEIIKFQKIGLPPMEERILTDLQSFCRHSFLQLVRTQKIQTPLDKMGLEYFSLHALNYLNGEHQALFYSVLPILLSNQKAVISQIIEQQVIQNAINPDPNLLKHLIVSDSMTSYIQSKGELDTQVNKYFRDQIREMITEARLAIDKNDDAAATRHLEHLFAFYSQNRNYIQQNFAWMNILSLGRRSLYKKQYANAKLAFGHVVTISDSSQLDEALFNYLWVDILGKNFSAALKTIQNQNILADLDKYGSKLKFWSAYVFDKSGQKVSAKAIWAHIIKTDPMSFYSIMALREQETKEQQNLANLVNAGQTTRLPSAEQVPREIILPIEYQRALSRLSLWLRLDLDQYSFLEIDQLFNSFENLPQFKENKMSESEFYDILAHKLAGFFNEKDKYLHTFRILNGQVQRQAESLNFQTLEFLFPQKYIQEIRKIDPQIDPLIILALIRQESAFNPVARSSAGARGLMQIMPNTGRSLQRNLKIDELNHPNTNLKLGIRYFKRLAKNYEGNLVLALAAYNAGQGNVKNWQNDVFVFGDDPLIQIELIPFKETRRYVKLIYRNIFFYNMLQDKSLLDAPFNNTLNLSFYEPIKR